MAKSLTERLGLQRWTADGDELHRTEFDAAHASLEDRAAGWLPDDLAANRPAAAPANARFFFRATDTGELSYSTGVEWVRLAADLSTPWTDVIFENGWVNYGSYQDCQYRKASDGRVELRGLMKSGTLNVAAFTLPTGFRPSSALILNATNGGGVGRLDVKDSGEVIPFSSFAATSSYFSVSDVAFDPT